MPDSRTTAVENALRVVRRIWWRRWLVVLVAWGVMIVCIPLILAVPERFQASARIYVDTQTVLKPLMVGLTYQPDIEQQVRMLAKTLVSRPNIEQLLNRPELDLNAEDPGVREKTVARLLDQVKVGATGDKNTYEVTYRDTSVERAQRLVEVMVDLFVKSGAGGKKRDTEGAGRFIEEQIKNYEVKLTEAEDRLKEFKLRNFGVSGVSNQDYFARMSNLTDAVNKLRVELNAAEHSREAYKRELSTEEPQLPADTTKPTETAATPEIDARLETQRKQLDDLLRRYTEQHPSVVSARRLIAQLEEQKRHEIEAAAPPSGAKKTKGSAATSPIYQKLRISLAETEAQIASLRSQLATQEARLEADRSLGGRLPQVEAELAQLNRDYDVIRKNYDLLVARRESASLGLALDESSQLAEFRVVEPPRVSRAPVFPSRIQLALAAVAASIFLGLAAAVVLDLVRPTVEDSRSLQKLSGRPVLGTVSMAVTDVAKRAVRRDVRLLALASSLLIVVQAAWLAWIALPAVVR